MSHYILVDSKANLIERPKKVFLSLGSNLGDREQNLELALQRLGENSVAVISASSLYETEPQDVRAQPWFLNLVAVCRTSLFPLQLLSILQRIERELGRLREQNAVRRGPRLIDIDILLFDRVVMNTPHLTIPHPRMGERRFVLEPLLEVQPDLRDPRSGEPWSTYLPAVTSQQVRKVTGLKERSGR